MLSIIVAFRKMKGDFMMEVKKNEGGFEHVDIKTAHGTIRVHQNAWGKDYPGIAVDFIPDSVGKEYQVAVIEDVNKVDKEPTLNVRVWENPWKEDATHKKDIALARIEDYFTEDDIMVKCPECGQENCLSLWNYMTEESYGAGIIPLTASDFNGELGGAKDCDYICPNCGDEIDGGSIIAINEET